jgi:hypothetical protein
MKTKTHVRAGGMSNHNKTWVRDSCKAKGLTVKTRIRAGITNGLNHNKRLVVDTLRRR